MRYRAPGTVRKAWALAGMISALVLLLVPTGATASGPQHVVAPQATPSDSDPPLTVSFAQFAPTNMVQSTFWGVNVRLDNSFGPTQGNQVKATPVQYLRYPGGSVGERYNYSTNKEISDSGGQSTPKTSISQFISECALIQCHSILQLPAEINSSTTAAFQVKYIEQTLGFMPAYWEIGNEPAAWNHYNIAWASWQNTDNVNTTPVVFGKLVLKYVTAIRAVDPGAQIIALGGTGQGSSNNVPWIKQVVKYSGTNLSAVSIHSYVGGNGVTPATLTGFFRGLNTTATAFAIPNLVKIDRAAILTQCPGCTNVKLFITEYAAANGGGTYATFLPTFYNALFMAGEAIQSLIYNVSNEDYFAFNNSFQGSWFVNSAAPTFTYYLYSMILARLGTTVYNTTNLSSTAGDVYALSTGNATERQVLIVNANQTQTLSVNFTGSGFPVTGSGKLYTWSVSTLQPQVNSWSGYLPTLAIPPSNLLMVTEKPVTPVGVTVPAARSQAVFRWDIQDNYYVLFGGRNDTSGNVYSDTWTMAGGVWTNTTRIPSPPALYASYSCYDQVDHYVVVWGGITSKGNPTALTWIFNNGIWTNLTGIAGTPPVADARGAMNWDGTDGYCLWFGGTGISDHQTWKFVGGTWTQLHPSVTPPGRTNQSMAYFGPVGSVVMFGGTSLTGTLLNDVWYFAGGIWSSPAFGVKPSARSGSRMAYDQSDNQLVLFGGYDGTKALSDTWTFSASSAWVNATPSLSTYPSQRTLYEIASNSSQITLWSGYNPASGTDYSDFWLFYLHQWSKTIFSQAPPPTNLATGPISATSVSLNWINPTSVTILSNTILYGSACNNLNHSFTISVQQSYTVAGLLAATNYSFAVTETAQILSPPTSITSFPSNCVSATTLTGVPGAPTGLATSSQTSSSILLHWVQPGGGGLTNNTIWYGVVCGFWATASTLGPVSVYNLTGLSATTTFCIAVSAWNATGNGPQSNRIVATTLNGQSNSGGGGGVVTNNSGNNKSVPTPPPPGITLAKIIAFLIPTRVDFQFAGLVLSIIGVAGMVRVRRESISVIFLMLGGMIFLYGSFVVVT